MQLIDTHVMMGSLSFHDLEAISASGVKVFIAYAAGGMDYATSAQAAVNYVDERRQATLLGKMK